MIWKTKKLADLCKMYQPKTLSKKHLKSDGKYFVYGANGIIGKYNKYNHEKSQLMITCRGATCGSINISKPFSWINGNAMVVQPNENEISREFLKYLFKGQIDFLKVITGTAQPQITRESLNPILVSYPSLPEQHRIVTKLDSLLYEIDKAIIIKNKKINHIVSLNQKIIDNHFLKFKEKILFDKIVLSKGTGLERGIRFQSIDKKFPYLKMNNINEDNQIDIKKFVCVDAKKYEVEKYLLKKGDFLFNTRNSTELVGKSAVFNEDGTWLFNNNILRVKFKPGFSSKFINFFLSTTLGKANLKKMKTGTTNVAAIYYKNLATLKIPLTTFDTQKKIVSDIEFMSNQSTKLIKKLKKYISGLESLKLKALSKELINSVL